MTFDKSLIAASIAAVLMASLSATVAAKTADENDSVYQWGRWAVLAPAAGAEEALAVPAGTNDLDRCASSANCPGPVATTDTDPEPPPVEPPPVDPPPVDPPEEPEAGGEPVGFARIAYPRQNVPQQYGSIVLNNDGTDGQNPQLDAGATGQSVAFKVTDQYGPSGEGFDAVTAPLPVTMVNDDRFGSNMGRPVWIIGTSYDRDAEGNLALIEGSWLQTGDSGTVRRGEYVWGITTTDTQLNTLMDQLGGVPGADIKGVYSGGTTNGGTIGLELNFSQGSWAGEVKGTVIDFQAGGDLDGARFNSDPTQFSSNVQAGTLEGALVNGGQNAIGGFDVTDLTGLHEADVFSANLQ